MCVGVYCVRGECASFAAWNVYIVLELVYYENDEIRIFDSCGGGLDIYTHTHVTPLEINRRRQRCTQPNRSDEQQQQREIGTYSMCVR